MIKIKMDEELNDINNGKMNDKIHKMNATTVLERMREKK